MRLESPANTPMIFPLRRSRVKLLFMNLAFLKMRRDQAIGATGKAAPMKIAETSRAPVRAKAAVCSLANMIYSLICAWPDRPAVMPGRLQEPCQFRFQPEFQGILRTGRHLLVGKFPLIG